MRFIAFLCVFFHHTFIREQQLYSFSAPVARLLASLVNACGFGLSLFFTLSAYLICELLLREKTVTGGVNLPRFYKRRMLRIWPLYFLGLALGMAWALHFHGLRSAAPWFAAYALMAGNIFTGLYGWGGISFGPASPLWSISIEEQFYLVWPAVARFCSERIIWLVGFGVLAVSNVSLIYFGLRHADVDRVVWTNSLCQFYMFGAGILLSLSLKGRMPAFSMATRAGLAVAAIVCWFIASFAFHLKTRDQLATVGSLLPGYFLIAAGCIALMLSLMGMRQVPAWLAKLGQLSYGLYVFHMLAIQQCQNVTLRLHLNHYILVAEVPAFALTLALAWLSFKYFEAPFRRRKDRAAVIHSLPPASLSA